MSLLVWIFRILLVAFVLRLVLRALGVGRRPAARRRPQERSGGTLVRDPQCGTYLPQSRALTVGHGSSATYFCSAECRDAYAASHGHEARAGRTA